MNQEQRHQEKAAHHGDEAKRHQLLVLSHAGEAKAVHDACARAHRHAAHAHRKAAEAWTWEGEAQVEARRATDAAREAFDLNNDPEHQVTKQTGRAEEIARKAMYDAYNAARRASIAAEQASMAAKQTEHAECVEPAGEGRLSWVEERCCCAWESMDRATAHAQEAKSARDTALVQAATAWTWVGPDVEDARVPEVRKQVEQERRDVAVQELVDATRTLLQAYIQQPGCDTTFGYKLVQRVSVALEAVE